ncbi:hypothetical protein FACS189454_07960 [Planctomycetales bacterium]|nr:hypothetical protein FACS189454_07960 [Planctomycetales bacterium]
MPYDRDKLQKGLERACWKRKISAEQLSTLLAEIEKDIETNFHKEVESQFIGERAMYYLSQLDQVAYVRFASVYQRFDSAEDFVKGIKDMREKAKNDLFDI